MGTIYNCDPSELIEKASEELKKVENVKAPEWAAFVKTGMQKERAPLKNDWWHTRATSILRQVYIKGPVGVTKLRTRYGGKKNRGVKKSHFYKASGNIIRKILQQLEKAGYVRKEEKSAHKGKVITAEGKKFLDDIAAKISAATIIVKPKKEVKNPVEKKVKQEVPAEKEVKKPKSAEKIATKEEPKKIETKEEVKKIETKEEPKQLEPKDTRQEK